MGYVRLILALIMLIYSHSAVSQAMGPEIPAQEKTRIASLAQLALRDKDITEAQYQSTMVFLNSRPCVGIDRTLSVAMKAKFAFAIAKTEAVKKLEVLAAFRFKAWRILYVSHAQSENNFLFYAGDPLTSPRQGSWSGGASIFETADIQKWLKKNIAGIPPQLASCFAWHVTLNRRD